MKYFLVGYMACGKSHYGRELANELGIRFIDLDTYIVERECSSINEIFAKRGEIKFRQLETRYLHEVCELYEDFVLATGGGTPCFNENMSYMNEQGETLFLDTDLELIIDRLEHDKQKRPLISQFDKTAIREYVIAHFKEREHFYRQAKKIVKPKIL